MYRPSQLAECLRDLGVKPKKGFSQNFLVDQNILKKILSEASIAAGDQVFEIGPGLGVLTEALLNAGANVYAVEKDSTFISHLEGLVPKPKIFLNDILTFPFEEKLPDIKMKVVANIPYHLTTPILELLMPQRHRFSTITLMVQEEVARRITASPKTQDYGSLTLFVESYADVKYCFKVSRRCFYPIPKVDSAVITLTLKAPPDDFDSLNFLIRKAFNQRRKMLRSSLRDRIHPEVIMKTLKAIGKNPEARPEELSINNFIELNKSFKC